ncbi:MAG TPA: GntR family transcriptional regulator [Euzebyales bacterium]|nr:GntR family transcriptional regulator [Euzebyales bacterium]
MSTETYLDRLHQPPPLRRQVYERLEDMIVDGVLTPGQHLVELELAERLGVSRNPVREALQALERGGWVDLRPRHGAFVHTPSAEEANEFFHVRSVLEAEAARLAAEHADEASAAALAALVDEAARTPENDAPTLADLNTGFHRQVAAMAGNRVLAELLGAFEKRLRWYFKPVAMVGGDRSWDQHAALVKAFAAGDANWAEALMREHTAGTAQAYRRHHAQAVAT